MSVLFTPLRLRGVETRNRVWVAPMCQYSADAADGIPTDWHLVHLGSRAVGGAGLVMTEATAVTDDGRITPWDLGIYNDAQVEAFQRITRFIEANGAVPAIQLAHAGRKASTNRPWLGGRPVAPADGGWDVRGPSAIAYNEGYPEPSAYSTEEVHGIIAAFAEGAQRAIRAGFRVIEIHSAHGYLLHQFLSPHTNTRDDEFGGSFAGRTKLIVEVAKAVRAVIPATTPLLVRISTSEYVEGGWDVEQSVALATLLKDVGVDMIDCSSGGNLPHQALTVYPGYQVGFAREIRDRAGIATGAVGLIVEPNHAEAVVAGNDADVVLLGREELRDPYWPMHAAKALGADHEWPVQYARAK
jgi:2,4-dienoyl-CoA reductase-like NADH-dependent reductase (Old Yellow Enzyme family)